MKKAPKQNETIVKEYVRRLSDDELNFIIERATQPVCGDRADISTLFEKDKEIDRWLSQSGGAFEWFDRVDLIETHAIAEQNKRQKSEGKEKK
jgi:hypothetical protein